ncbi:unnamed protein product [Dicrocoelium dendriticum]|nr:unnamed protein product [Dicrocoelium dendriticum]
MKHLTHQCGPLPFVQLWIHRSLRNRLQYQRLPSRHPKYYWKRDEKGYTPKYALVAGSHEPDRYTYIARAKINGKMAIGMLAEFYHEAYFVVDDAIETSEYYEILVWEKKPA